MNYGKPAGNLLIVRPRVRGVKSSGLLETKEARQYPVEFRVQERDTDTFEISLPSGYEVDDLPPPADVDFPLEAITARPKGKGTSCCIHAPTRSRN
jgi:hypothetical protein